MEGNSWSGNSSSYSNNNNNNNNNNGGNMNENNNNNGNSNSGNSNSSTEFTYESGNNDIPIETPQVPGTEYDYLLELYDDVKGELDDTIGDFQEDKSANNARAIAGGLYQELYKKVKKFHYKVQEYMNNLDDDEMYLFKRMDKELNKLLNKLADMLNEKQGFKNNNSNGKRNNNNNGAGGGGGAGAKGGRRSTRRRRRAAAKSKRGKAKK
jgi:hypothetical protein